MFDCLSYKFTKTGLPVQILIEQRLTGENECRSGGRQENDIVRNQLKPDKVL